MLRITFAFDIDVDDQVALATMYVVFPAFFREEMIMPAKQLDYLSLTILQVLSEHPMGLSEAELREKVAERVFKPAGAKAPQTQARTSSRPCSGRNRPNHKSK
jgi:hypothetical protein